MGTIVLRDVVFCCCVEDCCVEGHSVGDMVFGLL